MNNEDLDEQLNVQSIRLDNQIEELDISDSEIKDRQVMPELRTERKLLPKNIQKVYKSAGMSFVELVSEKSKHPNDGKMQDKMI